MAIFQKEWKQGYKGFFIWTIAITFMIVICVCMFPQMQGEMDDVSEMFANMGSFTQAFGMDKMNFGELLGFYGVECGNVLGIGGGFFAAYLGITMLAKEEKEHTAEFLMAHPIRRSTVLLQKLGALISQIIAMNIIITLSSYASILLIGEEVDEKIFLMMHIAYLVLQLEISLICFGISAFLRRGSIGIGLGLAAILYFMNIICNISEDAEGLKYITPFAYTEGGEILANKELDVFLILLGVSYAIVMAVMGCIKYSKKDLAA